MSSFNELGLSTTMLSAVELLGYQEPTAVQQQAIPAILAGKDVVAGAKTGTGKTAAFSLPCLDLFQPGEKGCAPQMLVVTPTRELAQQIAEVCASISKLTNHRILSIVGGVSQNPQVKKLKAGVDILIATPGRLIDLKNQGFVDLSCVRFFVLDEADRMLDMGFSPDIHRIAGYLPEKHQTMLFSATIDDAVEKSIGKLLSNPVRVEVARRGEVADTVKQSLIRIPHALKPALLVALLKEKGSPRVIVFARTRGRADTCARRLNRAGIRAAAIHSDRSQAKRQRALADFESGKIDVIVGTDVLARGIDVNDVSYVVNFDLPDAPEDYVHRIGRTGRAGKGGEAISFVSPENKKILKEILRLTKQQSIPEIGVENFDLEKAKEQAIEHAMRATEAADPEIAAAKKEVKARMKRKEKAKVRKAEEKEAARQGKKKKTAVDQYVKDLQKAAAREAAAEERNAEKAAGTEAAAPMIAAAEKPAKAAKNAKAAKAEKKRGGKLALTGSEAESSQYFAKKLSQQLDGTPDEDSEQPREKRTSKRGGSSANTPKGKGARNARNGARRSEHDGGRNDGERNGARRYSYNSGRNNARGNERDSRTSERNGGVRGGERSDSRNKRRAAAPENERFNSRNGAKGAKGARNRAAAKSRLKSIDRQIIRSESKKGGKGASRANETARPGRFASATRQNRSSNPSSASSGRTSKPFTQKGRKPIKKNKR